MRYESNPKHKEPWQQGRKGTLCPKWTHDQAGNLLETSVSEGRHRYATMRGVAFAAQQHHPGVWHGYPVAWKDVPPRVWRTWLKDGLVTKKQLRDAWTEAVDSTDD